jgi:hypothetical protein
MSAEPMPVALGYHPGCAHYDSPREVDHAVARTVYVAPEGADGDGTDRHVLRGLQGALRDYNIDDVVHGSGEGWPDAAGRDG